MQHRRRLPLRTTIRLTALPVAALLATTAALPVAASAPSPNTYAGNATASVQTRYVDQGTTATVSGSTVSVRSLTATAVRDHTVSRYNVCVRDSAGRNLDFRALESVRMSSAGTTYTASRKFADGTYTYWSCVRYDGRWYDVSAKRTFTVGATQLPPVVAPKPATHPDLVGYSIPAHRLMKMDDARLAEVMALAGDGGAGWIRFDFAPTLLRYSNGVPDWSPMDRLVAAADAQGLAILGTLNTLPASHQTHGWNTGPVSDSQRRAYTDFARRAAERYGTSVDAWELWNEPNLDQFWAPTPSAADYVALIAQAYPAVSAADPGSPVIAAGTGGAGSSADITSDTWYAQVYARGGQAYFDAVNVHPYTDNGWSSGGQYFRGGEMGRVPAIRDTMNLHGDAGKAIWGTEYGVRTGGSYAATEEQQALWLTIVYDGWVDHTSGRGVTGPLFYYSLLDFDEPRYGTIRTDGTKKPAYGALRQWSDD